VNRKPATFIVFGSLTAWILLGVVSVIPAMFSVMAFDAPGSESNPATMALVASVMSFPFACAIAVARIWRAYRGDEISLACRWACLPLVNVLVAGAAMAWITWFQGGKFAG
jgi:hypothetical protein